MENIYSDGENSVTADFGYEWWMVEVAAATQGNGNAVVKGANGNVFSDCDREVNRKVDTKSFPLTACFLRKV